MQGENTCLTKLEALGHNRRVEVRQRRQVNAKNARHRIQGVARLDGIRAVGRACRRRAGGLPALVLGRLGPQVADPMLTTAQLNILQATNQMNHAQPLTSFRPRHVGMGHQADRRQQQDRNYTSPHRCWVSCKH